MLLAPENRRRRLRVLLPGGPPPAWVGDLLRALDRAAPIELQVEFAAAPPPGASPWWHQRVPGLAHWQPDAAWREHLAVPVAAGPRPDTVLALGTPLPPGPSPYGAETEHWLLADRTGRALEWPAPDLDPVSAGEGWRVQLLRRAPAGGHTQPLRSMHVGASRDYAAALPRLAPALAQLVVQTIEAQRLPGVPGTAAAPAVRAALAVSDGGSPRPSTRSAWPWLRGRLGAWWSVQRARLLSEYWRVGVIDAPIHTLVGDGPLPAVRWLMRSKAAGYWADPFGLPGDPTRLACEFFDERTGVGHLETLQVGPQGDIARRTRLAVGGGRHTSFPHIFEADGRLLGVAEAIATRECVLHEVDADGTWRPLYPLLQGVAVVDPSVFRHDGRWWLAFTDADQGDVDNLCLYHADRLEGPWRPHANNPVRKDITAARMAGRFFTHDGALYRPAQDCLRTYGAAVVLHRVERLTPDAFEEVEVRRLLPDPHGPCPHGLHTLTAWGERTLVDGKVHGINPLTWWRKLRRRTMRRVQPATAGAVAPGRGRRVAVYVPHLRTGGGEISMLRLAEGLADSGLEVDLVVHSRATAELAVKSTVRVVSLDCGGTLSAIRRLAAYLRERRPQWLLSAFPHTNVAAVTALALSRIDGRCVISEHAPLSRQIVQQGNWRYRVLPPLVRWAYRRAHAVVAVSAGVRDDLQPLLGAGVAPQVIGNPVLVRGFEAEFDRAPEHPWLADPSLRVVLSVCRLSVEKDLPTLLRAFDTVRRTRPAARLVLAGEGPDRARLEALVAQMGLAELVSLPGWTQHPLTWMHRAGVFVLSSQYEGFGNVLVEALAAGTLVVSTDCPVGPRELLAGGRHGALVPVGDDEAMARAIAAALDAGRVLPDGAHEAALRYSQDNACAAYRRLFESLYLG